MLLWVHLRQSDKSLRQCSKNSGRFVNWSFIRDFVLKNNQNVIYTEYFFFTKFQVVAVAAEQHPTRRPWFKLYVSANFFLITLLLTIYINICSIIHTKLGKMFYTFSDTYTSQNYIISQINFYSLKHFIFISYNDSFINK